MYYISTSSCIPFQEIGQNSLHANRVRIAQYIYQLRLTAHRDMYESHVEYIPMHSLNVWVFFIPPPLLQLPTTRTHCAYPRRTTCNKYICFSSPRLYQVQQYHAFLTWENVCRTLQ